MKHPKLGQSLASDGTRLSGVAALYYHSGHDGGFGLMEAMWDALCADL